MCRQLVPGPVVRLTVIKAKTRPGIEATLVGDQSKTVNSSTTVRHISLGCWVVWEVS